MPRPVRSVVITFSIPKLTLLTTTPKNSFVSGFMIGAENVNECCFVILEYQIRKEEKEEKERNKKTIYKQGL